MEKEEASVHKAAMEALSSNYSCPRDLKPTDFENWISNKVQDLKRARLVVQHSLHWFLIVHGACENFNLHYN